jgi:signal transduction histidine kinase
VNGHVAGAPRVLLVNDRAQALVDRFPDADDGTTPEFAKAMHQVLSTVVRERSLEGSTTYHVEATDETFLVSWRAADTSLGHMIFSIVDVTAQEQSARALTDQIRARDQFVATVSHELRTPLTGAMGLLEILDGPDVGDETERRALLRTALDQTRDMADIIQDLLVAARADSGGLTIVPERLDTRAVVTSALVGIEPMIPVGEIPEIRLYADPVRVRQIIRNLATNANRYGGPRRRIVVRRTRAEVLIEVRDDGTPLDGTFRDRIFEPYARAEGANITASVGIGLTVSRTLARLMNGDLDYSHDGTEAVFTLRLPVA